MTTQYMVKGTKIKLTFLSTSKPDQSWPTLATLLFARPSPPSLLSSVHSPHPYIKDLLSPADEMNIFQRRIRLESVNNPPF